MLYFKCIYVPLGYIIITHNDEIYEQIEMKRRKTSQKLK